MSNKAYLPLVVHSGLVQECILFYHMLIQSRCKNFFAQKLNVSCSVLEEDIEWWVFELGFKFRLKSLHGDRLGWKAFYGTLSRHRPRYPWVLKELKKRLSFHLEEGSKRPPRKLFILQKIVDTRPF
jgi:hypothetical protein